MSQPTATLRSVLSRYPPNCQPSCSSPIGSGGYSGARLWQLETARGKLCLRQWSREHPDVERLKYIHAVLHHVAGRCGDWIAIPLATESGETYVEADGHLWELTPWLPGTPKLLTEPTSQRVAAAMGALAQFHLAGSTFPHAQNTSGPAPGILSRLDQVTRLQHGGLERLRSGVEEAYAIWPRLAEIGVSVLANFTTTAPQLECMLKEISGISVPIQPCIRDIHCEHVLFAENEVTGIVDFGAMRADHVTGDIARLLGSVAEADSDLWTCGLAAYERFRRLSSVEHTLLKAYHVSATALAGINWLQWIFIERREFADRSAVERRFAAIARRLERIAGRNKP